MKLEPKGYQLEGVRFLLSHPGAALFAAPGLGKTVMTLLTLRALKLMHGGVRVLISAPRRVIYNVWPEEIEKFDLFDFSYTVLHGREKEKNLHKDVEVYLINPEGLKWLLDRDEFPNWDTLVIDESSQYKNPSSVRFKLIKHLLPMFKNRYILTGTPAARNLLDLWSQVYTLDYGRALGRKITHYRESYFTPVLHSTSRNNYIDYEIRDGCEDIIFDNVKHLAIRMDETLLDLPELVMNRLEVTLPKQARAQYDTMVKALRLELESGTSFVGSATEKYTLCRDMSSGAVYTEKPKFEVIHNEKIAAVKELVGELQGAPAMVAYHRWHEYERLHAAFPEAPAVNGATSSEDSRDILAAWNRGEVPVLLVQCQTVAHGLNLQSGGNDIVWFSIPDNFELYDQLNRRLYRQGVKNSVRIHHIIARGTIDNALMARLADKDARQQRLFDAILEYHSSHNEI